MTLLQDADRLPPELPECLGRAAEKSLSGRGIRVRLGVRAARVQAEGVTLADGEFIASATVVTIGTRPHPVVERLAVPTDRGRIQTESDMAVCGPMASGRSAIAPWSRNALTDQFSPPTAQFAVAQAQQLAANLLARIAGRLTRAFAYRSRDDGDDRPT